MFVGEGQSSELCMYVCIYLRIVEGISLQIQHKYFNINIVYTAPKGLLTTFNTKQNIKLSINKHTVDLGIEFQQHPRRTHFHDHTKKIFALHFFWQSHLL